MATKLSWTELRRALASRANVSEKEANAFLTALNTQIIEALKIDKQLKINGLGTFKLQAVAPRKSVNVKTGEEITIAGYNKIVFLPEAGVKELVEKNSAVSQQPSDVNQELDPIKKLGAQAEEIVDILADLGQSPNAPKEPEPVVEEKPAEPIIEEKPVEPVVEEKPAEPIVEEKPAEPIVEEKPVIEEKPKKKHHFWRDTLICVIILLALLAAGYYFLREEVSAWIKDHIKIDKQTEQVEKETTEEATKDDKTADYTEEAEEVTEEAPEETQEAAPEAEEMDDAQPVEEVAEEIIPQRPVYNSFKQEEVRQDSRLAWISYRYYKSKIYWPYIYDANKEKLSNPNIVRVGQKLRIPVLTKEQLDTTNAQTRATIEFLRREAEEKMK